MKQQPGSPNLLVFGSPSRYVQGEDATSTLGTEMARLGFVGPVLLLASSIVREQLEATWQIAFETENISLTIQTFGGECSQNAINAGVDIAKSVGATSIVGAGGGKCLDTGRAIAATLDLPVVNCPSLASSDAPCSALSVVYTDEGAFEQYLFYKKNPDLVLVDTALVAKAPTRFLVAGMGDALATWFEARTVIEAGSPNQLNGGTTQAAGALAKRCYEILLDDGLSACQSVNSQTVTPSLDRIVEANTLLSGLGFESGGLAIAHSVHNGLTTAPGTHEYLHGEKVAFGLLVQLIVEERPQQEIDEVLAFSRSVGLPVTLAEVGVASLDSSVLSAIATRSVAEGETAHHEPFAVTASMIEKGIIAADSLGRRQG